MKKTYQNPTTKLVKIKTVQMIAASVQMYGTNATSAGMGRDNGGDFWEDEEE